MKKVNKLILYYESVYSLFKLVGVSTDTVEWKLNSLYYMKGLL